MTNHCLIEHLCIDKLNNSGPLLFLLIHLKGQSFSSYHCQVALLQKFASTIQEPIDVTPKQ